MKYKLLLFTFLFAAVPAHGAITIYNQNNPPDATDLPSGGWGTYRGFSVTFNDVALTTAYTAPDASPTPSTLYLTDLTIRHPGNQGAGSTPTSGDWTTAMVKVYTTQTPTTASYIGDSLQTNDLSQTGTERNLTYTFSNLQMTSGQKYYFYFANTAGNEEIGDVTWAAGRLRVSNNANLTYSSGNLVNQTWGNQDTAFDAVFAASFSSVPEPSVTLLGGIGMLLLFRRRR
jgi:hypothetical protein